MATSTVLSQQLAYRNFVQTCRSPATRKVYLFSLHSFMDYLGIARDQYDKLLDKDPKIIEMHICDYISFLRGKNLSYAVISLYVAALNKFYSMNDIQLNWKKIKSFIGERERVAEDRPYNHSEIQTLIHSASQRNRAIILLMSSAGLRAGAIPILRIRDLQFIDKYRIYKINVYAKSRKSSYFSFCTPECRKEIDLYLDYRRRWGERLRDDSPLFRADFNTQKITNVKSITVQTIEDFMESLLMKTGLRKVRIEGKYRRSDVMMNHGFRKFFETNAFKAGMDHMYLRRLMGQKSGLEDSYLKLSEEELLEGDSKHLGFINIIDQLTINEENRLRKKVETLTEKQDEIQKMKYEHECEMKSMREELESKFQQVLARIDTAKLT
jgi:integrase